VLEAHEHEKEKKYLEACLERRRHFPPFMLVSTYRYGLLGNEDEAIILLNKKLSAFLLAALWTKPYSEVCGYVIARMSIAILVIELVPISYFHDEKNERTHPEG
jgi:hypothetical protein